VKLRLLQLARTLQFLDRGFAEYFQVAVLSFGKQHAQRLLHDARKTISKMQKRQGDPASADVGDLGLFCEQIARTWGEPDTRNPKFVVTQRRDEEIMCYLQDALEIPYWEFMIDIFLGWKANSNSLSGDVVLRVLHSAKLDLLDGRRHLFDDIASLRSADKEDIAPIIDGIDARIEILDSLWNSGSSYLDGTHHSLVSFLEQPSDSTILTEEKINTLSDDEKMDKGVVGVVPALRLFRIELTSQFRKLCHLPS
jgi:hypothetical protein